MPQNITTRPRMTRIPADDPDEKALSAKKPEPKTHMEKEEGYMPPSKPGEMHSHAFRGAITHRVIGTMDEGEEQASRARALQSMSTPANWSPRDINLPNEEKTRITKKILDRMKEKD